jgi:hypothetical protein
MTRSFRGGHPDRLYDALIGPAPANIALHGTLDLDIGRIGCFVQQRHSRENHARRAVAALHRVSLDEGILERMQLPIPFQSFDGRDLFSFGQARRRPARPYGSAIEQDGASAALPFTAAILGADQVEFFAEDVEERPLRIAG